MFAKSNELENMRKLVAFSFPFRNSRQTTTTHLCVSRKTEKRFRLYLFIFRFVFIGTHDDDDDDSENFKDLFLVVVFLPFTDVH